MRGTPSEAELMQELADLLRETAEAHHRAYLETDGADPEWPLWYAGYLQDRLSTLLGTPFTRSELVYLLVSAERAHVSRAPGADWPAFYAAFLLDQHRRRPP